MPIDLQKKLTRASLLGFTFLVVSCEALKGPQAVDSKPLDLPDAFAKAESGQNKKISVGWLKEFRDPRMTKMVLEALEKNQGLRAAAFRLKAAEEGTIIGRAARLLSVNASNSYRQSDGNEASFIDSYNISLNAAWEPDLWGRLRNLDYATRANYAASVADFRGARLSLAANTAQAWCNLVTAEQQLSLAKTNVDSFATALGVVERRYKANTLRAVDVQFARNNVANSRRSLSARQLDRDNAARNLQIFLGRYPAASIASASKLPYLAENIPVGFPSGLLERRPDLQASRARLYASAQTSEAARKNLLPDLRVTTGAASSDPAFRRVFDPNFLVYSIAASLTQTVYQGGALSARARAALDQNRAAIEDYVRLALLAFREVESAIETDRSLAEQEAFLKQEVKQSQLAVKRALSDISLGIDGASFLEYLEAQRRAETAGISLIRLKNQRLQNRIDLHLALGGDYHTREGGE
ncbi:MAG: efflux transporter outer membrane subunit [Akkermansiaceae bacterium]